MRRPAHKELTSGALLRRRLDSAPARTLKSTRIGDAVDFELFLRVVCVRFARDSLRWRKADSNCRSPSPGNAAYGAAKGGLLTFTRSLALETRATAD